MDGSCSVAATICTSYRVRSFNLIVTLIVLHAHVRRKKTSKISSKKANIRNPTIAPNPRTPKYLKPCERNLFLPPLPHQSIPHA